MTNESAFASVRSIVAPDVQRSVVIVVANGSSVEECLARVSTRSTASDEVVLVDRRDPVTSDDLVAEGAIPLGVHLRVVTVPGVSSAVGRAVGLAIARGRHVLLYDEDVLLSSSVVDELLERSPVSDVGIDERLDLIRDLERGSVQTSGTAESVADEIAGQVERIRHGLIADPDRHADVVAGVRARGIARMPWSMLNRGRARDLAILHNFVPFIDTSGLVAASRLREWGVLTDVVSQDLSATARLDERNLRIVAEVLDEARIIPGRRKVHRWPSVVGFVEAVLLEVADLEATKGRYRSLYSRAMPPASHLAAAILKLRSPELRWVAEFSDPLLYNAYGEMRSGAVEDGHLLAELVDGFRRAGHAVPDTDRLFGWAESVAYAFADEIIFTNEHQRDFMLGYASDQSLAERARGVARIMYHPVPEPERYMMASPAYALTEGQVHIGFFGNFYPNRGLAEIIGALDSLTFAERDLVRLHVFTSRPDALRTEMLEQGLADVVEVNPMFGYFEYLNLLTRFDVLLINDYATSPHYVPNPYLPAKLADYRGCGTPIWALYEPGSILSQTQVEHASRLGDVDAATKVLRGLLRQHQ